MTWRDQLELGSREDAASRKDNLPPSQIRGPELPAGPGRSPEIPLAREDRTQVATEPIARTTPGRSRRTGRVWARPAKRKT
jgi:hypothetical protein